MNESTHTHKGKTFKIVVNPPFTGNVFPTNDAQQKYSVVVTDEHNYEMFEMTVSALLVPHIEANCGAPIADFLINAARTLIENRGLNTRTGDN